MIIDKNVKVAKETSEVMDLLVTLVKDIKAKKTASQIAGDTLSKLMTAIEGIDQVDDEAKENLSVMLATVGYSTGDLAGALIGPSSA